MSGLLAGLLGALIATNQPAAVSNLVVEATGISVKITDPNDPVEKEFQKLIEQDNAAHEEVDRWIDENNRFVNKGAGLAPAEMKARALKRLEPVEKAYLDFLQRHTNHVEAYVALASYYGGIGNEYKEKENLEKALALNTKDPAIWNNLANFYGHNGPTEKAFEHYDKAIALNPKESLYYQNAATTVYLFRKAAMEYYGITEQEVYDKALALYQRGLKLDPANFALATDLAQTYYGIKPVRTDDALGAWTNALKLATNDVERQGVHIHLARFKLNAGRYDEARGHLKLVTESSYDKLKDRLTRNIDAREYGTNAFPSEVAAPMNATNRPPGTATNAPADPHAGHSH